MIVGITTRLAPVSYGSVQEERDALAHDWLRLFHNLDVTPVLIPNALSNPTEFVEKIGIRRLLLSGGDSLGTLVNEQPAGTNQAKCIARSMPTHRDLTESVMLDWAWKKSIPVLGVCRGLQMINSFFGGSLTRSLSRDLPQEPHAACEHKIRFVSGPFTDRIYNVNSYHDEGVLKADLAPPLEILAETRGGVVEALHYPGRPIYAVQWHPERYELLSDIDNFFLQAWLEGE